MRVTEQTLEMSARLQNWSGLRLVCAGFLILLIGGRALEAAKLDPSSWMVYPLTASSAPPAPPTGLQVSPQGLLPAGQTSITPMQNPLAATLTDNNPDTFVTLTNTGNNSIGLIIDMGQPNVVDRLFLIGANHTDLNFWPNCSQNANAAPLGLIVVSVGNSASMMTQVGTWTVPYDAGNPVDTEVDLRFSPVSGRYVKVLLQTNVIWGAKYWPGYALSSRAACSNQSDVECWGGGALRLSGGGYESRCCGL